MQLRTLAGLNRTMSAIGAGCWTIGGLASNGPVPIGWAGVDDEAAYAALQATHELGITVYDTADVYGLGHSERLLGRFLRTIDRRAVTVTSKVGYFAGTAAHPYHPTQLTGQFETTLANLGTGYLDGYFLHSSDFGPDDRYLDAAVSTMSMLRAKGLIRSIGMRAPHEFAEQWAGTDHPHASRTERFLRLFRRVKPDLLTVRYNLLSPRYGPQETDIFAFARRHGVGVLIKQVLGQGVLTGRYDPHSTPVFPAGDHRAADPMFRPAALAGAAELLSRLGERFGTSPHDRLRVAVQYALAADPDAVVLVGFRDKHQIATTTAASTSALSDEELADLRSILAGAQDHPRSSTSTTRSRT
jgi:aryl-alcohol dehydrogenase-like predicted oxidoreductase